jgi:hypothetical protein
MIHLRTKIVFGNIARQSIWTRRLKTHKNIPLKFALHMSPYHNKSKNTWENLLQSTIRGKHLSFSAIENSVSNYKNKHILPEKLYKWKNKHNKIYVCLRLTNASKEGFASSVAYSNHKVGSTTKLPLTKT